MIMTQEDQAYHRIKVAISKGYIKKGSKLKEMALAQKMGMSRATVKGAVKRLVFEGLAKYTPNKGVSVVNPSLDEIKQTLQVRSQLEQMAVELAQQHLTSDDFKALQSLIKDEKTALKDRSLERYHEINDAFHLKIAEKSQNRVLHHYIGELLQKTTIFLILFDPFYQLMDARHESPFEHAAIVSFLERKETEQAARAIKEHLESTINNIDIDELLPSDYLTI